MNRLRKQTGSLDYPLLPQRRRPWLRLILAGVVIGVLAFVGWQRLGWKLPARTPSTPEPAPPTREGGQVVLVRSEVVTPTATTRPTPVRQPSAIAGSPVDEVDEVESPWHEQGSRSGIITYTVQSGDTLWSIAGQFDLDVDTLRWSNPDLERNPDLLSVDMTLVILPVKGIYHSVEPGETLDSIAQRYGVAEADILNYPLNKLESADALQAGAMLIVPHGRKELVRPTPQLAPDSPFAWPLVGVITQGFTEKHQALDIGAPYGSPVFAGRAGQVVRSGWARTGYGYTVIIDHGEGLQSLYSHMKGEWVQVGAWVERGQLVGEVGSTGNSSGPHVHFEVRVEGERMNPVDYLPAGEPG